MTNFVKKLAPNLINQISAGEVIERPASAVKELVDNAIDAGAKNIQIQILSQDGRTFRVTDDGSGIHPNDIDLAFEPHATSKIATLDDLNSLETKGFRGEALASICSVSRLTCTTKHISSDYAVKAAFDKDGSLIKSTASLAKGTSFEVRDLFANVPVRLKFLKKSETELQAINDVLREAAIAHPEIGFELQVKDKRIFKTSGSGNWEISVKEVLQESLNFKYLERTDETSGYTLKGLIAPLSDARSDARSIVTLVNRRPIQCQVLRKAVKSVYQGFLATGKYPRLILSLTVPPGQVDVNVHPTKKEVRYSAPGLVYQMVQSSLEKHLISHSKPLTTSSIEKSQPQIITGKPLDKFPIYRKDDSTFKYEEIKPLSERSKTSDLAERTLSSPSLRHQDKVISEREIFEEEKPKQILRISELELKKLAKISPNKSYRSERGQSTDFCLQSNMFSISGQISGNRRVRDHYLNCLSEWLAVIEADWEKCEETISNTQQIEIFPRLNTRRETVALNVLENVWKRDGWRCVYCGKYLLHPKLAKKALRADSEGWISRLGSGNKVVKTHIVREHQASHDHYLPVSHNPSLSLQEDNLYACCRSCNQSKSNSTNKIKWQPQKYAPWEEGQKIQIGNLLFSGGNANSEFILDRTNPC